MSTIKTTYVIQSCPVCGTPLARDIMGSISIRSPLLTCSCCGKTYRTDMRTEWEYYPKKWPVYVLPVLIPVVLYILGTIIQSSAIGVFCGFMGLIISAIITIKNIILIQASKQRMKSPVYISQLHKYGVITAAELNRLMDKIK